MLILFRRVLATLGPAVSATMVSITLRETGSFTSEMRPVHKAVARELQVRQVFAEVTLNEVAFWKEYRQVPN